MAEGPPKFPDHEELEKELSDYLSKKYGHPVKVVSPVLTPQVRNSRDRSDETEGMDKIKFNMKPEELESYLNQYVIRQEESKAILATKICTHYNRIRHGRRGPGQPPPQLVGRIKNNILLIGPTGVGKTYLVKLIAQKLGVPFVKGDATKFSETGYVGGDVEDLVRELVVEAADDIELAEHGIIYVDEVDKIASSQHLIGPDVSRTGVQRALLKPMEETEVDLKVAHDPISQLQAIEQFRRTGKREKRTVNTRNILFIMSGAFNGLAGIVKKRMQAQGIGFGAQVQSKEEECRFARHVKAEDLIEYGFESEFVGRLPVIAVLEPLEVEDLYQILKNPNNPVTLGKKEDFRSYGIDIRFEDDALALIAERAYAEKTGARGLVSAIEKVLLPFEKSLPSTSLRHILVSKQVVLDPAGELKRVLANPDDPEARHAYELFVEEEKREVRQKLDAQRSTIESHPLVFTPRRLDLIADCHLKSGMPLDHILSEVILLFNQIRLFENDYFERHGFKICFNDEAVNEIMDRAIERSRSASAICLEISRDFDYGFKLIMDRTGETQFSLPREAVVHHETYLDELIRETYRRHPLNPPEFTKEMK